MEKLIINGGNRLSGSVKIESAKNSVLPILAGSILAEEQTVIKNCPKIQDVINMIKILNHLGVKTKFEGENLIIDAKNASGYELPLDLTKQLRASVLMLGALISRFKKAKISYPGGCNIGKRPIDLHLKCLKQLGIEVIEKEDFILCKSNKNTGGIVKLDFPSVGATENLMMVAVLLDGKTEIRNCAREPEIVDLMKFLNKLGAKIYGAGTSTILIEGVKKLKGEEFLPIADRIELETFILATSICGGKLQLFNCNYKNICSFVHKFCDNTCKIYTKNDIMYVTSTGRKKAFSFRTGPYPQFPTDLQPQASVLATIANGTSVITETVFENRFNHLDELKNMGANVKISGRTAYITGVERLTGCKVCAQDLRGGAALVLAGLNADGQTVVEGVNHIRRGYLDFDKKLRSIGANIKIME